MTTLSLGPVHLDLALRELILQDLVVASKCVMPSVDSLFVGVVEQQSLLGQVIKCVEVLNAEVTDAFDAVHYVSDLSLEFRPFDRSVNAHQLQYALVSFKQIDFTVDKSDWIIEFELFVWERSRLDQSILLGNRLCIPKLVWQYDDAECDQKGDENEYSSYVRPHIHELIVAREETPAQ